LVWHWIRDFWDMWEFYDGIASISIWYTWSTSTYTGSIHQSCLVRPQFSRRYRWDEFLFFMRTCAVAEVIAPSMVPRFSCGPAMEIWAWRRLSLQFMWKRWFFARFLYILIVEHLTSCIFSLKSSHLDVHGTRCCTWTVWASQQITPLMVVQSPSQKAIRHIYCRSIVWGWVKTYCIILIHIV
jgi:hypothetical protein